MVNDNLYTNYSVLGLVVIFSGYNCFIAKGLFHEFGDVTAVSVTVTPSHTVKVLN